MSGSRFSAGMRWAASMSMTLMRVSMPCLGSVSNATSMRGFHQDHVVHEVTDDEQRLGAGIDHEAGMSDRVSRGMHRLHSGNAPYGQNIRPASQ
jgi:hypothetical protein